MTLFGKIGQRLGLGTPRAKLQTWEGNMFRYIPIVDGEWYHIVNRGNDRQTLFRTARDYEAFTIKFLSCLPKYKVEKIAYVLMPNHFHIVLVQHSGGSLPRFMKSVETSLAKRYNLLYSHQGHVLGGPYRSVHIPSVQALLNIIRYVHLNPVRAGLVRHPSDWRYSDFNELTAKGIRAHDPQDPIGEMPLSPESYSAHVCEMLRR